MRAILVTIALSIACFGQGGMMPGPGTVHSVSGTPTISVTQSVSQCVNAGTMTFTVGVAYNSITFGTPATGSKLVALTTMYNTIFDVTGVAAAPSGTFTANGSIVANSGQRLAAWSVTSPASVTAVTLTAAVSQNFCVTLIELATTSGTIVYDSQDATGVNQSAATWTSLAFTPTASKSAIVFGYGISYSGLPAFTTGGTGYTALNTCAAFGATFTCGGAYKVDTNTSGSYTPNGNLSGSGSTTATGLAYRTN